jgi:SAM-dependent methyltransferase
MLSSIKKLVEQAEQNAGSGDLDAAIGRLRALCLADYGAVLFAMPLAEYPRLSALLPRMASVEMQQHWTGSSGKPLLQDSITMARLIAFTFESLAHRGLRAATVLDYGCGYGRLMRMMSYHVDPARLWGVDPSDTAVAACAADKMFGSIRQSDYLPVRLPVDGTRFDLSYAYSVFTHTSRRATFAALKVLRDTIRADGVLAITVRPIEFWDVQGGLDDADRARLKEAHQRDGFAFFPHGGAPVDGDITYGDTSMDPDWLAGQCPEWELRRHDRGVDDLQTVLFFTPR